MTNSARENAELLFARIRDDHPDAVWSSISIEVMTDVKGEVVFGSGGMVANIVGGCDPEAGDGGVRCSTILAAATALVNAAARLYAENTGVSVESSFLFMQTILYEMIAGVAGPPSFVLGPLPEDREDSS